MLRTLKGTFNQARLKSSQTAHIGKKRFKGALRHECQRARRMRDQLDTLLKTRAVDSAHSGLTLNSGLVLTSKDQDNKPVMRVKLRDDRVLSIPSGHLLLAAQPGDTILIYRFAMDDKTFAEGALPISLRLALALGI